MSENIPFEIQLEIIKKVSSVKSLIQFRSVSKSWKSFIDSSEFIKGYGTRHTQPHSRILRYKSGYSSQDKYICLVDDDNETFKVQNEFVMSPLLKQYYFTSVVGACHGLLCLCCYDKSYTKKMFVIWNPSIRKSFGIAVPSLLSHGQTWNDIVFGFGVSPHTRDPTVVKILCEDRMTWHIEVFTLSSGVWNVIPSSNFPRRALRFNPKTQAVIDRFICWGPHEKTFADDGRITTNHMVVSFDLITKEFKVVELPHSLTNKIFTPVRTLGSVHEFVSVCNLRESLVVFGYIEVGGTLCCSAWVMEHDSSFRNLFSIYAPVDTILGVSKLGETVIESRKEFENLNTLDIYDPCSQHIKNLGICGVAGSFFMDTYKESLLLLDHSDLHIYYKDN